MNVYIVILKNKRDGKTTDNRVPETFLSKFIEDVIYFKIEDLIAVVKL